MDASRIGWSLAALAALLWIPGWAQLDMQLYLLINTAMVAGFAMAAAGHARAGLGIAATALAAWVVGFTLDGFLAMDVLAALLMSGGLAYAAVAARPAATAAGILVAAAGNLWYLAHNTFLGGTPAFALGNWVFAAAAAVLAWSMLRRAEGARVAVAPA